MSQRPARWTVIACAGLLLAAAFWAARPTEAQDYNPSPGELVFVGAMELYSVRGEVTEAQFIRVLRDLRPFTLDAGGLGSTGLIIDTKGLVTHCVVGVSVTRLQDDPNAVAAQPTLFFRIDGGPDGRLWNKVTDVGAICSAEVDPNDAAKPPCLRQDFTFRAYPRFVRLQWNATVDPNNLVFSMDGDVWMSCSR